MNGAIPPKSSLTLLSELAERERRVGAAETEGIRQRCAVPVFGRRSDVVRIGAHPVSGELAIDPRAARLRMLVLLQHDHPGALAQHEAVAVDVPRTTGGGRVVVARGERLDHAEAADT